MLYFDQARAVVEFVGCVCGLWSDRLDLADYGYGCYVGGVDYEGGFRVGLCAVGLLVGLEGREGDRGANASINCLIVTGRRDSLP